MKGQQFDPASSYNHENMCRREALKTFNHYNSRYVKSMRKVITNIA